MRAAQAHIPLSVSNRATAQPPLTNAHNLHFRPVTQPSRRGLPSSLHRYSNSNGVCAHMNRFSARVLLLTLSASHAWAQSSTPAHLEETKAREAAPAKIAPIANQQLFGAIPVSTRSDEARKFVEF